MSAGDGRRRLTKTDLEARRIQNKFELLLKIVSGATLVLFVLASALPLWLLKESIEALAGHETVVRAQFIVSTSLAISVVINIGLWGRGRSRTDEIRRLRSRTDWLEEQLGIQTERNRS